MHDTSHPEIKFHLDAFEKKRDVFTLKGWILHFNKNVNEITLRWGDKEITEHTFHDREDVFNAYPNATKSVGFIISFESAEEVKDGEFFCSIGDERDTLLPVIRVDNPHHAPNQPQGEIGNACPSIIAIDNFYKNPDEVREYALSLEFQHNKAHHKGQRTPRQTLFDGTYEFFEDILKKKITSWGNQPHNGVFQFCTAEDQLVYHTDGQKYAAVVFLTPNAPPEGGTSFFKHRGNGLRNFPTEEDCASLNKSSDELYWDMFRGNFYDKSPWDLVDVVGNVYNRMAIWDAKLVHAASQYFGDNKENSRLFHMFFFDAE
tara:strand:+ start:1154 stop:2104 length:951 start_codon:yes stop_codon:yes gene_type:complete